MAASATTFPFSRPGAPARRRRILVIHNPEAGHGRRKRLSDVLDRLDRLGCAVVLRETRRRGDAERLAREATAGEFDAVAVAGGDGTVNEVVNGLVTGGAGIPLAVIPLGTANVLACEIGIDPRDAEGIARTVALGNARTIHLGTANGRHFVVMAGAGLDAQVVEGVSEGLKRRAGRLAYLWEGMRQALGGEAPALEIRAGGQVYHGGMAVACRGRHYGGRFVAAPDASLEDASLHICILPRGGAAGLVRYGLALPLGRLPSLPEVQMISASSVTITGPRGGPVQGDGDIVARLPAEIAVARETVDLVCPE